MLDYRQKAYERATDLRLHFLDSLLVGTGIWFQPITLTIDIIDMKGRVRNMDANFDAKVSCQLVLPRCSFAR